MARPIKYNKAEVLNNAMKLFWKHGYDSTSMKDLIDATGLTTRSLYNMFESKNGLFKAALEWYYTLSVDSRFERLKREQGLTAIRNYMDTVAKRKSENGCLFVNTTSDRFNIEENCLDFVEDYFDLLENEFISKFEYAKEFEDFRGNPKISAKQLIILIEGISVHSKKYPDYNSDLVSNLLELMEI